MSRSKSRGSVISFDKRSVQSFKPRDISDDEAEEEMFLDESVILENQKKIIDRSTESDLEILIRLKHRYPKSQAFAPQDDHFSVTKGERPLSERLLEFELEKCLKKKEEIVERRKNYQTKAQNAIFSTVLFTTKDSDLNLYRKERIELIHERMAVPQLPEYTDSQEDMLQKILEAEMKRDIKKMNEDYLLFCKEMKLNLKLEKYKIVDRYAKFCDKCESLERNEQKIIDKLSDIDTQIEYFSQRIEELCDCESNDSLLTEKDFIFYIQNKIREFKSNQLLRPFLNHFKWIGHLHRFDLLEISMKDSQIPVMLKTDEEVLNYLSHLKAIFNIQPLEDDQEEIYEIRKFFANTFEKQVEALKFDNTYSVHKSKFKYYPEIEPTQDSLLLKQQVILNEIQDVHQELKMESNFIDSNDITYVSKRLKELAQSHFTRANESEIDPIEADISQDHPMFFKLNAVYMLQHILIRDFKRRILEQINYCYAIKRMIFNDSKFEREMAINEMSGDKMYDEALNELSKLDEEFVKIGTHFLSHFRRKPDVIKILYDLYEQYAIFMEKKRELIDLLLEAYSHDLNSKNHSKWMKCLLDFASRKMHINLEANYFLESMKAETEFIVAYTNLIRELIRDLIIKEKRFRAMNENEFFDFYTSLGNIVEIPFILNDLMNEFASMFRITNPQKILILLKNIVQQAHINYYKIIEQFDKHIPEQRREFETFLILMDENAFLSIIQEVVKNHPQIESKAEQQKVGQFLVRPVLHNAGSNIYLNSIEVFQTYFDTLKLLHECDVLEMIYRKQAEMFGYDFIDILMQSLKFEDEEKDIDMHYNLAILEFDSDSLNFKLLTIEGLKGLIQGHAIKEWKHIFQYQLTHHLLLELAVRINQTLLDDFYVSNKKVPDGEKECKKLFVNINDLKEPHREKAIADYKIVSDRVNVPNTSTTSLLQSQLREVRFRLVGEYCKSLVTSIGALVLKLQMMGDVIKIRYILSEVKEGSIFIIGKPKDKLSITPNRDRDQKNSTCLMSKSGHIANVFYVPHIHQILRMKFSDGEDEMAQSLTRDLLRSQSNIIFHIHMLLKFHYANCKIIANGAYGSKGIPNFDKINQEMNKLKNEIEHLSDIHDSNQVRDYLRSKCKIQYFRSILALQQTISKFKNNEKLISYLKRYLFHLKNGKFDILDTYLIELSEADRNYYNGADMSIEISLEDILSEEQIYQTSMPVPAAKAQIEFLTKSIQFEQLKEWYMEFQQGDDYQKLEHDFHLMITKKTKALLEKETQEGLKRKELQYREKQLLALQQELCELLILQSIRKVKEECFKMKKEFKVENMKDYAEKLEIFNEFTQMCTKRALLSRNKDDEVILTIPEQAIDDALERLHSRLTDWKEMKLSTEKSNLLNLLNVYKTNIFAMEQKLSLLMYQSELYRENFISRVQAQILDTNFDIVYHIDLLKKQNAELQLKLDEERRKNRIKARKEYENIVEGLVREMDELQEKFTTYRQRVYKDLSDKFTVVKNIALLRMEKLDEVKTVASNKDEEEIEHLKKQLQMFRAATTKLRAFQQMQIATLESKYERKIKESEEERERASKSYYGKKMEIEERASILRNDLIKAQNKLTALEMEAEQLRANLQAQIKNKQKLVNWKVKNAQILETLTAKVEKYERWKQYDVDKLLQELDDLKLEIAKLSTSETLLKQQAEQEARKRQIEKLKRKLHKEQRLKSKYFHRLDSIRHDSTATGEGFIWQKKYFDAMAELNLANREIEVLKTHALSAGLKLTHDETPKMKTPKLSLRKISRTSEMGDFVHRFATPTPTITKKSQTKRAASACSIPRRRQVNYTRPLSQGVIRRL